MIIHQVDTYPLYHRLGEPYGDANGLKRYRSCCWIRIQTHSGIEGWGECSGWLPTLQQEFQQRIIPYLLGKKSLKRSELVATIGQWNIRAAAGVSMALTEIGAKGAGMSICEWWGGARRATVPVYASFQSYTESEDWMGNSQKMVEQAALEGFTNMKVKVGAKSVREDQQHISRLVKVLAGRGKLAVDANQSYDRVTALEWNPFFKQGGDWLWFEEPLPINRVDQYKWLRPQSVIPIAGGENITSPAQFLPLLRQGGLDQVQPDPIHVGSVDHFRDALTLARQFGVRVSPHTFDGPLSRLYALFAQSCLPPWSKMKTDDIEPVEWDVMENRLTALLPLRPTSGSVTIPTGIGIGVEPDKELLAALRWDGSPY